MIPYVDLSVSDLWAALLWSRTLLYGGLANNLHDTLSYLYLMGMVAVTVSFFVVIPYGLLCQYVMNAVAHSRSDAHSVTLAMATLTGRCLAEMIVRLGLAVVLSMLAAPGVVWAQPAGKVYRIGYLSTGSATA